MPITFSFLRRRRSPRFLTILTIALCSFAIIFLNLGFISRYLNLKVVGWEYGKSLSIQKYMNPGLVTTLTQPNLNIKCSLISPPEILIIVCSKINHFKEREAIRQTWGYLALERFHISIIFMLGVSNDPYLTSRVHTESIEHGDIVVENFVDTYNNLTIKSMMALKWLKDNCNITKYYMKVDDDVYLNLPNLVSFIRHSVKNLAADHFLCGILLCNSVPNFNPFSKWYMPYYLYPHDEYPNYLEGFAYLMYTKTALKLYQTALNTPLHPFEDVYFTGICATSANVKISTHYMMKRRKSLLSVCSEEDRYIIIHSHGITEKQMYAIHDTITYCPSSWLGTLFDHIRGLKLHNHNLTILDPDNFRFAC